MSTVAPPTFTDSVNQKFFIEAQGGAGNSSSYLDTFPSAVYTKAIDSSLVKFLYALLGPVGVGFLRQEYLAARLQFEDAGLSDVDLDGLYGNPFAFARLAEETYELDASAALLPSDQRQRIIANDASYRNRAIDYLKAIRAGGTKQGIALAAKSGLNRPVEVIENYRVLYDNHSDAPLGLPALGTTTQINEVVVLPRQDRPMSAQQTLSLIGPVSSGWFSLTYPSGPNLQTLKVTATSGSPIVTVPSVASLPPGASIVIPGLPVVVAQVGAIVSPTQVSLVHPAISIGTAADPPGNNAGTPGQPYNIPFTGSRTAFVGYAQTTALPYNATASQVQSALSSLPALGPNVKCFGGPLPSYPIEVQFTNALADTEVLTLLPNVGPDVGIAAAGTGIPQQLVDTLGSPLTVGALITPDTVGVSADGEVASIGPADAHAMQSAMDNIRPVTAFVTTAASPGLTTRQPANTIFGGSSYTEVLRYATGSSQVMWPQLDALHWIEQGKEHEAPRPSGDLAHHYINFHNLASAISYTEEALEDPNYESGSGATPLWVTYYNAHIGSFNSAQATLYPFLAAFTSPDHQFGTSDALAATPEVLGITDSVDGVGIVNSIYPKDYLSLPGINLSLGGGNRFFATMERSSGVDYLEIDLGTPQAVNYLYFEATRKPFVIDVAYDTYDQAPKRHFIPATILSSEYAPSITNLTYDASATNPWERVEIHCTNALSRVIFTRFIRLGFTRTPGNSPLAPTGNQVIPYSIEIRNVRVGRNVS